MTRRAIYTTNPRITKSPLGGARYLTNDNLFLFRQIINRLAFYNEGRVRTGTAGRRLAHAMDDASSPDVGLLSDERGAIPELHRDRSLPCSGGRSFHPSASQNAVWRLLSRLSPMGGASLSRSCWRAGSVDEVGSGKARCFAHPFPCLPGRSLKISSMISIPVTLSNSLLHETGSWRGPWLFPWFISHDRRSAYCTGAASILVKTNM